MPVVSRLGPFATSARKRLHAVPAYPTGHASQNVRSRFGILPLSQTSQAIRNASLTEADCINCPSGRWIDVSGSDELADCVLCEAGLYSPEEARTSESDCIACSIGTYSANPGAPICDGCVVGRYAAQIRQTTCVDCEPGERQPTPRSGSCISCDAGTYQAAAREVVCNVCRAGEYADRSVRGAEHFGKAPSVRPELL